MCYYEKVNYVACGHEGKRLIQYCHFARNDPLHQCFGAWSYKRELYQRDMECENCTNQRQILKSNGLARGDAKPVY
ncbi:hypothetical protein BDV95DRAFT_505138 [Massariosphaeria phaeospora]|uniref:Uncharacterized protein n=1 Tax=Massariosphaeria phaeospora TaxID=100035 RepID=A0A7C8M5I2_9PLEO|nr:hypothetical protein BDV95DRAFT_505138 [Massariosphaeria phaeospora]